MTVHVYGLSLPSHIASGLAADLVPDVWETIAVMGGQTAVALYSVGRALKAPSGSGRESGK
jgi:hypothetical protein